MTLRIMIISPDVTVAKSLEYALAQFDSDLTVCRVLDHYPESGELVKILRAHAPSAVFLGFQNPNRAVAVAKEMHAEAAGLQILGVHDTCDPELLRESMHSGIREFLTPPFERATISRSLGNVLQNLDIRPVTYAVTDQVLAFLPAKAGAGATSLALNIAAAFARRDNARVFLGDLDLNSGVLRFLLNVKNEHSIVDAVLQAADVDELTWPGFVTSLGNLDVLHAGHVNPAARLESDLVVKLIQFVSRNYQAVCLDLSGNLERYSIAAMQETRHVVLVCTPEIPSLHLAREKMTFLKKAGLDKRVLVVLNRMARQPTFSKTQVEDLLETPVFATFSNDYAAIHQASQRGKPLDPQSLIGQECLAFTEKLLNKPPVRARSHKFLQHFWMPHGAGAKPPATV